MRKVTFPRQYAFVSSTLLLNSFWWVAGLSFPPLEYTFNELFVCTFSTSWTEKCFYEPNLYKEQLYTLLMLINLLRLNEHFWSTKFFYRLPDPFKRFIRHFCLVRRKSCCTLLYRIRAFWKVANAFIVQKEESLAFPKIRCFYPANKVTFWEVLLIASSFWGQGNFDASAFRHVAFELMVTFKRYPKEVLLYLLHRSDFN